MKEIDLVLRVDLFSTETSGGTRDALFSKAYREDGGVVRALGSVYLSDNVLPPETQICPGSEHILTRPLSEIKCTNFWALVDDSRTKFIAKAVDQLAAWSVSFLPRPDNPRKLEDAGFSDNVVTKFIEAVKNV